MNIFQAAILGIVQGLTEFLPVSSSGHLVLFQKILGVNDAGLFFDTMLHMGTLVAVVVVLWPEVSRLLRHPIQKMMGMLIVATLPAVAAAVLFGDFFEGAFEGKYLAFGFMATGLLLSVAELVSELSAKKRRTEINYPDSIIIGCMQAVAILPGVSRSGSTLVGGLMRGIEREKAANFAFLMSIPVILGSVVYQGMKIAKNGAGTVELLPTVVGVIFAAVSGFFAVKFMLNLVKKHRLFGFAIYVALLGLLVLLDQLMWNVVMPNPFI